jgi:hypothetical protein
MHSLLASGCSFTDNWWTEKMNIDVWPEGLAKKLDMECINLGRRGLGNDYILNSVIDKLSTFKGKIGLVVVMWSGFDRIDFEVRENEHIYDGLPWISVSNAANSGPDWVLSNTSKLHPWHQTLTSHAKTSKLHPVKKNLSSFMEEKGINGTLIWRKPFQVEELIKKALRTFYIFQEMMIRMNLPYIQLVGTQPLPLSVNRTASEFVIRSPYMDKIDESRFVGWPIFENIGGWCINDVLNNSDDVRISEEDYHPNNKGHEIIIENLLSSIYKNSIV